MADIDPTFYDLEQEIKEIGMNQGDIAKAIYNLYQAVRAICNNIDEDSGAVGTDYSDYIRTPLESAMSAKMPAPKGGTST